MRGEGGGPRTAAGKAKSRNNAVKHGLRASSPIVRPVESAEHWKRHLEGVVEGLQPEGYLESELAVRDGESVVAGTVIGSVGLTGNTTGAHLHLEITASGEPVDPLLILPPKP